MMKNREKITLKEYYEPGLKDMYELLILTMEQGFTREEASSILLAILNQQSTE